MISGAFPSQQLSKTSLAAEVASIAVVTSAAQNKERVIFLDALSTTPQTSDSAIEAKPR